MGSPADLAIIAVIALVVFGPKPLPQVMWQIRQALVEFHRLFGGRGGGPGGPAAA